MKKKAILSPLAIIPIWVYILVAVSLVLLWFFRDRAPQFIKEVGVLLGVG